MYIFYKMSSVKLKKCKIQSLKYNCLVIFFFHVKVPLKFSHSLNRLAILFLSQKMAVDNLLWGVYYSHGVKLRKKDIGKQEVVPEVRVKKLKLHVPY